MPETKQDEPTEDQKKTSKESMETHRVMLDSLMYWVQECREQGVTPWAVLAMISGVYTPLKAEIKRSFPKEYEDFLLFEKRIEITS